MKNKRVYILFAIACVVFLIAVPFMAKNSVNENSTTASNPPIVQKDQSESLASVQNNAAVSNATNFEKCKAVIGNTIDSVATQYKTATILDNDLMYTVRICTNDGSVLATCSAPDGNVNPITKASPDCPL